ncbi:hypothetical protein [Lacipirellula parvula]|uniref:Uncharacterized protein n=1 Tax=Lacipirellula parvula TaxID=2650471 RepID=A0A5K7X712_9BACT|nr:hypothetical protein [Lacipirellula parvula]BBO32524.1 hypothetical protein PLANPX_2136 [Lacipirellula parvula]
MKPLYLLAIGVVVGWAASGVDWSREAVGQESSAPAAGAERPIRRGEGVLRGRLLRQMEAAAPTPATDAPAFTPNDGATAVADSDAETSTLTGDVVTVPRQVLDSEGRTITVYEQHRAGSGATRPSASANPVGRFQVSAYGSPNGTGCYVVDSTTGQTWLIRNGQAPEVVAKTLLNMASAPPLVAPTAAPPQVQYGEPVESLPYLPGPPTPQNAN